MGTGKIVGSGVSLKAVYGIVGNEIYSSPSS